MCVIVHVGARKSIAKQVLENCYANNPDGWGIMFAHDGQLHIAKEVSTFDKFYAVWREVPRDAERAVHFRIKTHGEINDANCHPFKPTDSIAMMHNGIITTQMLEEKMSDTYNYCEYELKPVMSGWANCLEAEEFKKLVEDVTGFSKLLFLNNEGKTLRLRPNLWSERNGIGFSNGHSMDKRYTSTHSTYYRGGSSTNWSSTRSEVGKYEPLMEHNASDLYSGNKTDKEGQDHISSIEEERDEIIRQQNDRRTDVIEENEEIDGDPTFTLDFDQLNSMSYQDKLDWIQDYPKSALHVIEGLLDTLTQAGIFDLPYQVDKKSAVK